MTLRRVASILPVVVAANACLAAPPFPELPPEGSPPERVGPLIVYFEGPDNIVPNDPLWTLPNTRFQFIFDTRFYPQWRSTPNTPWTGNGHPEDLPAPAGGFRPYAGPQSFAQQVLFTMKSVYAEVPQWPVNKPKKHAFQLNGINGQSSPWRDHDNPNDYIAFGGDENRLKVPIASATDYGTEQVITSSEETFTTIGGPLWSGATSFAKGTTITGGQWRWICTTAGTSGLTEPDWDAVGVPSIPDPPAVVTDGTAAWRQVGFPTFLLSDFQHPANRGVFRTVRKRDNQSIAISRVVASGGDPERIVNEQNASPVYLNFLYGPDLWRDTGRSKNDGRALAHFQAVKEALSAASNEDLPPDISRSFDHYVEDDEARSEMHPNSVEWYTANGQSNMPDWETDGYWQLNANDPRATTDLVDGVYYVQDLLDRASTEAFGGAPVPQPTPFVSPWSPTSTTLRVWQWINQRAVQRIIAEQRFKPFRDVFDKVPCGNWNFGGISGDAAARLVFEPNDGNPSAGLGIDNYEYSDQWGMSIPAMYPGVLGDYRHDDCASDCNCCLTNESHAWSTQANWTTYAALLGYPTDAPTGVQRAFQLGECALTEYAKKMKRNYGFEHLIMPSFDLTYIPPTSDLLARKWTITRLAQSLGRGYRDGWVDRVWAFAPTYHEQPELRDAWFSLSKQIARVTTCRVDFDGSGAPSVNDVFAFLQLFGNAEPEADFNEDRVLNVQDVFDFLAVFNGGTCG